MSLPAQTEYEPEEVSVGSIEISVNGKWVSVPSVRVNGNALVIRGKWIRTASPHDEEWLEREFADPALCIEALKRCDPRADLLTFSQKLPNLTPKYDYPIEWISVAVAFVKDFTTWWASLPQETRKNIRRSQKRGVVIRVQKLGDPVLRGIAEVQNETPIRQGRRYPHFGKTLEQVKKDHSSFADRSEFICAYCGDEFIGFLKLVYRGDIASILQLNSKISHHDKRPSNALLAMAVELCSSKGISHLTYGHFNYGNKVDSSLREFKIRNGFCDTRVPRFYVPLTPWGEFCVRTKLHRGLFGILPHAAISTFIKLRSVWYARSL